MEWRCPRRKRLWQNASCYSNTYLKCLSKTMINHSVADRSQDRNLDIPNRKIINESNHNYGLQIV